jgi:hypothetical protein
LEGFEGSNDTDEKEVISACIKIWKLYDKNLTLELDLMVVPRFVEHVQEELKKGQGDPTYKGIGMKETYFVLGLMDVKDGKVSFRQAVEAVIRLVLAENLVDKNPDDLRAFALELDEVANGGDGGTWKSVLESEVAPAIVKEMAVRRMQMVFRAKRSVNAVRFAKELMVSTDGKKTTGATDANHGDEESPDESILNRGDMPAAG